MWVKLVVSSLPCSQGFSPDTPVFRPLLKNQHFQIPPNSNSIWTSTPTGLNSNVFWWVNKLHFLPVLLLQPPTTWFPGCFLLPRERNLVAVRHVTTCDYLWQWTPHQARVNVLTLQAISEFQKLSLPNWVVRFAYPEQLVAEIPKQFHNWILKDYTSYGLSLKCLCHTYCISQIQQNNLLTFQLTACNSLRLSQNVSSEYILIVISPGTNTLTHCAENYFKELQF